MSFINKYIGIPYKIHGRDFSGCDCYGITRLVLLNEFNKELPLHSKKYDISHEEVSKEIVSNIPLFNVEKVNSPKDGDIVVFYTKDQPTHMGLYIHRGVLHTNIKTGSIYEKRNSPMFTRFQNREYYRVV